MADTQTIDSLSVQMTADFSKANRSITNLCKRLDKLNVSMSNLGAAANATRIYGSFGNVLNVVATSATELNSTIKKLNVSLDKMVPTTGLKKVEDLDKSFSKLSSSMGSASTGKIKTFTGHTKKLNVQLTHLRSAAGNAAVKIEGLGKSFAKAIVGARAIIGVARRLWGVLSKGVELASDLTEVQNVVDKAFGGEAGKIEDLVQNSIQTLGMSELTAKEISSRFQAMGSAMGISGNAVKKASSQIGTLRDGYNSTAESMADMSINLTKLSADMASFYNVGIEDVAQDLQAIFTGQTRPLRQYGLDLTQATLQEWALKQGIDADVQSMTQAEKTLLRYQYVMKNTALVHGDFIDTADTWANQIKILKQQFEALGAVIGSGLINALKPFVKAMNAALSGIISFARTVINALGKIFGWEFEISDGGMTMDDSMIDVLDDQASGLEDVADAADDVADATKKAKKEEEEYQRTVLGFDELNKLNKEKEKDEDSGSSPKGSTGSAASPLSNLGIGDSAIAADDIKVSVKRTKALYESEIDSLYELGEYVGDTLKKALDSIKWDDVYQGARNFGTGLAEFLNGLISPELFAAIGKTIGNSLNTVLHALNAFTYAFDFKNLGKSINAGIKALAEAIDTKLLSDTFGKLGEGIADVLNEMFDPDKAGSVGKALGEGINAVVNGLNEFAKKAKWEAWGKAINADLQAFLDAIDMDAVIEMMGNFGGGIADFLNGLADVKLWQKVGSHIAGWLNAFINFFKEFGEKLDWAGWGKAINTGVQTLIDKVDWGAMQSALITWGSGIAAFLNNFVTPSLGGSGGKAISTLMNNFMGGLNALGTHLDWKNLGASIQTFVNSALENFDWALLGTTISTWANGFFDLAKGFFAGLSWDGLFSGLRTALSSITWSEIATNAIDAIWTALSGENMDAGKREQVLTAFSGLETTLGNIADFVFSGVESLYTKVLEPLAGWMLSDGVTAFANIVTNQFSNVDWDKLAKGISDLATALGKFVVGTFEGFVGFFEDISEFPLIGMLLNSIAGGLEKLFGSMDGQDYSQIENMGKALGFVLAGLTTYKIASGLGTALSGVASALPGLFSALAGSAAAGPLAVLAGGGALIFALDGISDWMNKNNDTYKSIKNTSDQIENLAQVLASGKIGDDTDYQKITTIFDSFWELNEKLAKGGELTASEETMFTEYLRIIGEYAPQIKDQIDVVTGAYKGTRSELELLIGKQREQAQQEALKQYWDEAIRLMAEAQLKLDDVYKQMEEKVIPGLEEVARKHNIDIDFDEEDILSFIHYLDLGNNDTSVLTEKMLKFRDEVTPQAFNEAVTGLGSLWTSYDEGHDSLDKANALVSAIEEAIAKTATTTSTSSETIATAWGTLETKSEEAEAIISEKATGMYTDVNARLDDINTSLEQHGIDGGLKIGAFPWESDMAAVMTGIETAVNTGKTNVDTTFDTMSSDIDTKLGTTATNANTEASDLMTEYSKGVKDNQGKVDEAVDAVTSSTDDKLSQNAKKAQTRGEEMGDYLATGINNRIDSVKKEADYLSSHAINTMTPRQGSGGGGGHSTLTARSIEPFTKGWRLLVTQGMVAPVDEELGMANGTSSVMDERGQAAIKGMEEGSTTEKPNLLSIYENLPDWMQDALGNLNTFFKPSGEDTIEGMKQGEKDTVGTLEDVFVKLPTRLKDQMTNLESTFKNVGQSIIHNIKTGINDTVQSLYDKVSEVQTGMFNLFNQGFYDRYWRIGHDMMNTLVNGINSVRPHIPVPHFDVITGIGANGTPYPIVRNLGWYAKGGVFTNASIIGVGEAGREAVLPLENSKTMSSVASAIASQGSLLDEDVLTNAFVRAMAITGNGQNGSQNQILNVVVKTENDEVLARAVTRGQRSIDYRNNPVSKI